VRAVAGSPQACTAYAYGAIRARTAAPAAPPACAGLSRAQVNQAAANAIRMTVAGSSKAGSRRQAGAAARWLQAMITSPPAARPSPSPALAPPAARSAAAAVPGATGLGVGPHGLAAQLAALLAWLAAAGSGAAILVRWLLAGGTLRRASATAAPSAASRSAVTLAHAGGGAGGLVLWAAFMVTGQVALAWAALGLLAPVAGLGMCLLLLGLPRPSRAPLRGMPRRRDGRGASGFPAAAVAAHGLFMVTTMLLVLLATVAAA
jgi:hypothetical protein